MDPRNRSNTRCCLVRCSSILVASVSVTYSKENLQNHGLIRWYDSSINNIRSKTSILAVRKLNNPKLRRLRVFRLDESSLSFAGFYGFKTVEIEVFDLILLIFTSYHHIPLGFLVFINCGKKPRHKAPLVWATQ